MNRLFLDANVLFTAAHNPNGKAALIFTIASRCDWELVSSDYAVEEARRNLNRRFPGRLDRFALLLDKVVVRGSPGGVTVPVALPAKDRPILAAAMACGATHLLTGDLKDFGPYMNDPARTGGVVVQTVSDFLGKAR